MIFDVRITHRADFVPRRGRNVRRGHAEATIPVSVREISSSQAPPVLEAHLGGSKKTVRTVDDLLYVDLPFGPYTELAAAHLVKSIAGGFVTKFGFDVGERRRGHPMGDDATVVSSQLDYFSSRLQAWLDEEVVLIDGKLHRRTTSPVASIPDYLDGDPASSEILRGRTGCASVPCWFPPDVSGEPFHRVADRLRGGPRRLPNFPAGTGFTDLQMAEPKILDADLFASVASDPRNVLTDQLADIVMKDFKAQSPERMVGASYLHASNWIPHLLRAVAAAEANAGTPFPEIEAALVRIASHSDVAHLPDVALPDRSGTMACVVRPSRHRPKLVLGMRPSAFVEHDADPSPIWIRERDLPDVENFLTSIARQEWAIPNLEGIRFEEDDEFDAESWNLKAAMAEFLTSIDARIGLLLKEDVDALARMVTHLRDWRTDIRLTADPVLEDSFVRDADRIVRRFDEPVFQDVGEPWIRDMARSCCMAVLARSEPVLEEDSGLRGFAF